jgi:outer membrane lipoprotein-sorting protein
MRKFILAAMLLATAACAGSNAQPQPAPPPPAASAQAYDAAVTGAEIARSLVGFQRNGAHTGTKAFFERYARLDDRSRTVPAAAAAIPADIQPDHPERV